MIRAAVFDLDGVVTFTARVHAAAWKELFDAFLRERANRLGEPFRPFTESDYRAHVDGRPRYDGVRTFLMSRGISVPEGDPSDPSGAETVTGLGNRKDAMFQERLGMDGVDVDWEAVRFIRELRTAGVRVGVASSSRNTAPVLQRAGLEDLFEARVDGVVSAELKLRGKPAPDIFLTCLEALGGPDPAEAMVLEDAESGVEAGRAGGFGLVVGVDRGGRGIRLRERGADWVVPGFADLTYGRIEEWFANRGHARPNALTRWAEVVAELDHRTPAVFLDYDGTLTPIVDRPEQAVLSEGMKETLRELANAWPTAVVSGRGRDDVTGLVGLDGINYAGSHGFDISGPDVGGPQLEVSPALQPVVAGAAEELRRRTSGIPGALVEDKKFAVAVHYRLVDPSQIQEVEAAVDAVLHDRPELKKAGGKMVFELRPAMDWDKGKAVVWLLEALGLDRPEVIAVYLGDDETDEDAFAALEERGLGIVVTEIPRPTTARYSLQDVEEVRELLRRVAAVGERENRT